MRSLNPLKVINSRLWFYFFICTTFLENIKPVGKCLSNFGSWAPQPGFHSRSAQVNARSTHPLKSALFKFYREMFNLAFSTSN